MGDVVSLFGKVKKRTYEQLYNDSDFDYCTDDELWEIAEALVKLRFGDCSGITKFYHDLDKDAEC